MTTNHDDVSWADVDAWRKELHRDFERALAKTELPKQPDYDYEVVSRFLIKARGEVV
jgi:uncharacterized protein